MLCSRCQCEIENKTPTSISEAIFKSCEFFKISPEDLITLRSRKAAQSRMMLMKYLRTQGYTLKKIADQLGGRHHSTTMHSITTINNDINTYPDIALQYEQFLNFING